MKAMSQWKVPAAVALVILSGGIAVTLFAGSMTQRNLVAHLPGGEHPRIDWNVPARTGVAYRFELSTHCGVNYARFDRRWWEATPMLPEDREKWGFNSAWGTMTLLDSDKAIFNSDKGAAVSFVPVPLDMHLGDRPARRDATGKLVVHACA